MMRHARLLRVLTARRGAVWSKAAEGSVKAGVSALRLRATNAPALRSAMSKRMAAQGERRWGLKRT